MSFTQFNTQDMFKTVKFFNPKATEGLRSFDAHKHHHYKGAAKVRIKPNPLCELCGLTQYTNTFRFAFLSFRSW